MHFDFGTLVYILFILGSLIFSVYKNAQKGKNKARKSPQRKSNPKPAGENFDPHRIEEFLRQRGVEIYDEKETTQEIEETANYNFEEGYNKTERSTSTPKRDMSKLEKHLVENDEKPVFEFDPVKAVIYSEIMKRKF